MVNFLIFLCFVLVDIKIFHVVCVQFWRTIALIKKIFSDHHYCNNNLLSQEIKNSLFILVRSLKEICILKMYFDIFPLINVSGIDVKLLSLMHLHFI